jgi:hypothetical protein
MVARHVIGAALVLATGWLACGESSSSGSSSSKDDPAAVPSCTTENLCDAVYVAEACGYCNEDSCTDTGSEPSADEDAVRCVLEALRDRTPGRVSVTRSSDSSGYCGTSYGINIISDGTGYVGTSVYEDLATEDDAFPVSLLSVDAYQACLDAGPDGALECLRAKPYDASSGASCVCDFCDAGAGGDDY